MRGIQEPGADGEMVSTMDVLTGGRMELGIGAGWKRDEWDAYGFGFPTANKRLGNLADHLEIISKMFAGAHATHQGQYASVTDAINLPGPVQRPRVPIMVGGNGPKVTWRLAARYADELNLDTLSPEDVAAALPVVAQRCEEIGRDPRDLRISLNIFWDKFAIEGPQRIDLLGRYAELGLCRVMGLLKSSADTDDALESLASDCRQAGIELSAAPR